jgi:predicted amidohydrolase YtcJ
MFTYNSEIARWFNGLLCKMFHRYTKGSAYASFWDDQIGSLLPTKFADFVVLSHNPFLNQESASPSVLATYVAGVLAHPVS